VIEISHAEPGSVASRNTNRCTFRREIHLGKQRKERHEEENSFTLLSGWDTSQTGVLPAFKHAEKSELAAKSR
jgi:hypothetical protein